MRTGKNWTPLKAVAGAFAGFAFGMFAMAPMTNHETRAQPAIPTPPPGTPAGVNWTTGKQAGGVVQSGPYLEYRYLSQEEIAYHLRPGAGFTLGALAAPAIGTIFAGPVGTAAGGVIGGVIAGAGSVADKTTPLVPVVVYQRDAGGVGLRSGGGGGGTVIYFSPEASGLIPLDQTDGGGVTRVPPWYSRPQQ
jgi:hypothetical protein